MTTSRGMIVARRGGRYLVRQYESSNDGVSSGGEAQAEAGIQFDMPP